MVNPGVPRGLIPGILDAHKQLWLSVRSGLASGKSVGYMRRRVARGVVVQTQNLNKRSSSNTKLCLDRAWNISWVFWEGKYFGKVVESDRGFTVWKLSDFTESGVDEVVYEVSNPPY